MPLSAVITYAWPSPSIPKLLAPDSHIPITNSEGSWIIAMTSPGVLVGAVIASWTIDW